MHRGVHESKDNARSVAYTHQVLSNEGQDDEACGEPQGNVDTRFLHSFTHPSTPPPEEAEELPNTQRQLGTDAIRKEDDDGSGER